MCDTVMREKISDILTNAASHFPGHSKIKNVLKPKIQRIQLCKNVSKIQR